MCSLGESTQSSGSNQNMQSGFSQLPPQLQQAFTQYGSQLNNLYSTDQSNAFKLPTLNAGATQSLSDLSNNSFAPTASNINANMALQTNPYDSSVIDTINRQAQGQGSVMQQGLNSAGQFGSNRATLGANDIDLSRLQQIGDFQNGEYQTAMNNALTTIPAAQTLAAQNSVTAGQTQQQQQYQNQQAPYAAMQSYAQNLGVLPSNGGATSSGSSDSSGQSVQM